MSRVRVHGFSISLDGFGTGEPQTLESPFGHAGERLHQWMFETAAWQGGGGGRYGIANDLVQRSNQGVGATIMGRNMFAPSRGPWTDDWKGWWGDNPPYHHPTFVMTHHPHADIEMEGGTTFRFVSGTPAEVLEMARDAANGQDVQVSGGVSVLRAFLKDSLIDEAHIVVAPIVLGRGERLWDGMDMLLDSYEVCESVGIGNITHLRLVKRPA